MQMFEVDMQVLHIEVIDVACGKVNQTLQNSCVFVDMVNLSL